MELLNVKDITKRFGGIVALDGVSCSIKEGEIVGLIGPNGAGKTTFINVICGAYPFDSGKIEFRGKDIAKLPPHKRCKLGMSRTYQIARPFLELTTLNSVVVASYCGKDMSNRSLMDAASYASYCLEFVGLFSRRNILAHDLSLYEMRMLELARAIATRPKLLFIDEAMAGLNPAESLHAVKLIMRAKEHFDLTILWIEHVMSIIMEAAERILVLHYGQKIAEGTPEEIVNNKSVIEAYLGGGEYA